MSRAPRDGSNVLNIGIIGCGFIGEKRANNLAPGGKLIACADINETAAIRLAKKFTAQPYTDWHSILEMPDIDIVIVATLHNSLADITKAAILAGKHVLVEKPAALASHELEPLVEIANSQNVHVRVGFNHRFHRALQKAKVMINNGDIGELMFIRARYGHGGRLGYDREWRSNPALSGGGELIDQGPHLIDLSRWFLGEFNEVDGFAHTYYWDMPVDDNGFMILKNHRMQVAFLHASCTEWKNIFSMEIYGKNGKLEISGLGGSYGVEKLTFYRMLPEMGPPETYSWEFPMADNSWALEMQEFYKDISLDRPSDPGLNDAIQSLKIVEAIYRKSNKNFGNL